MNDTIQILIRMAMKTLAGYLVAHALAPNAATADQVTNGLGATILLFISYGWSHWHLDSAASGSGAPPAAPTGKTPVTALIVLGILLLAGTAPAAMNLPATQVPTLSYNVPNATFNVLTVNSLTVRSNSVFTGLSTNVIAANITTTNLTVLGKFNFGGTNNVFDYRAGQLLITTSSTGVNFTNIHFSTPFPPGTTYIVTWSAENSGETSQSLFVPQTQTTNGFNFVVLTNTVSPTVHWLALPAK
jgi:hypothetical protein